MVKNLNNIRKDLISEDECRINFLDAKKVDPVKKLAKNPSQLELVEADLTNPDSWAEAVKDIEIVIHTASPFPAGCF